MIIPEWIGPKIAQWGISMAELTEGLSRYEKDISSTAAFTEIEISVRDMTVSVHINGGVIMRLKKSGAMIDRNGIKTRDHPTVTPVERIVEFRKG
jgi:hypothetical protein